MSTYVFFSPQKNLFVFMVIVDSMFVHMLYVDQKYVICRLAWTKNDYVD